MKIIWGISALNHDASISVVHGNQILFAAHAERYSRIKNDAFLNEDIVKAAMAYGRPDLIVWFERPFLKKSRQLYAWQLDEVLSETPHQHLKKFGLGNIKLEYVAHHTSHAAAGYFTSPYDDAAIIVVDAIGEWETITAWDSYYSELNQILSITYPNSLGLLYSAMTHRIGLKPNEEEYILMGMAAYGKPIYVDKIKEDFIERMDAPRFELKENVHCGIAHWEESLTTEQDFMDIAASIQQITEEFLCDLVTWIAQKSESDNLILMGGVALNCVANEKIARLGLFDNIWIMPNPGDAGSSLGCIAAYFNRHLRWKTPYLGTDIDRKINTEEVVNAIIEQKIIGIANGRAEFGPRALGNRSLIADPRGTEIKSKVNEIKKRQQFRPFAPIILAHLAHDYFDLPVNESPYMQFTAKCLYPEDFPAICHVDGSSRVQTLRREQNPVIYDILELFYKKTGCPMLLNTSLNIKGEPLVDTWEDAMLFSEKYDVPIY